MSNNTKTYYRRLIAEFIGWKVTLWHTKGSEKTYELKNVNNEDLFTLCYKNLSDYSNYEALVDSFFDEYLNDEDYEGIFHYDLYFSTLISVVEYIEKVFGCPIIIQKNNVKITHSFNNIDNIIFDNTCDTKLEAIFKTVIEFIEFYNKCINPN